MSDQTQKLEAPKYTASVVFKDTTDAEGKPGFSMEVVFDPPIDRNDKSGAVENSPACQLACSLAKMVESADQHPEEASQIIHPGNSIGFSRGRR